LKPKATSTITSATASSGLMRPARESCSAMRELDRAGQPVDQAEAEEQERRRHAAEQEIFQRGLGGLGPVLVEAGQHIEREAGELEREEREQQLLRGGHQGEAGGRKQDDRDVLGGMARPGAAPHATPSVSSVRPSTPSARGDGERCRASGRRRRPGPRADGKGITCAAARPPGADPEGEPPGSPAACAGGTDQIEPEHEQGAGHQRGLGRSAAKSPA
jgi:hypothetical protein